MSNDNNMVNNPNQGMDNNSPIIPQNIQMSTSQDPLFQNNNNTSLTDDEANYTPAVNVPGLDELEDYIDEEAAKTTISNPNIPNPNLNSNNLNPSTSVNPNQVSIETNFNIQNQPQIDMAVVDESFDDNSKNFSPNIDVSNLTSAQDLVQDDVFNPSQELGLDANTFNNSDSPLQSKPVDFGFDPFNKFDEATEENFLPGFDQNFYNPDYDDSTNFMPGIVSENEVSNPQPAVNDVEFIPNETINIEDMSSFANPVPMMSNNIGQDTNVVEPSISNASQVEPMNNMAQPEQYAPVSNVQNSTVSTVEQNNNYIPQQNIPTTESINSYVAPNQPVQNIPVVNPVNNYAAPVQPMQDVPMAEAMNNYDVPVQPISNNPMVDSMSNYMASTQPIPNTPTVEPVNNYAQQGQPVQNVPMDEPINNFVSPQQISYTPQMQQQNVGFVNPTQQFVQPTMPAQSSMDTIQNIPQFESNNIMAQNNYSGVEVSQTSLNTPSQPTQDINQFASSNSDDLVNSIDSLEDYSKGNQMNNLNNYSDGIPQQINILPKTTSSNNYSPSVDSIRPRINYSMSNFNSLLTPDKKIVTFIGAAKNGTSFLVNNLAVIFSSLGINTAILDMTQNRNSYYIYTKCDENLRKVSYTSIEKLKVGESEGIKVNKNLTVYTALPNDGKQYTECEEILTTLAQNHSLVLIDCDFSTPIGYFALCQEIYLVQTLDILTIQPLTAFLRDLKLNNILEPEKVRVVINKDLKVGRLTSKIVISGMSSYNDPAMSYMTELFNKDTVNYCVIPFDERAYSRYLEGVVNCEISVNGFSSSFVNKLKILAEMIYPLKSKQAFGKNIQGVAQPTHQQNTFSRSTNNTLNKMKNNM